jgi:glycosyltransferase involved in cell wall biosynthesis
MLFRLLSRRAERCVGVSPAVLRYMQTKAKLPVAKTRLITNGISAPVLSSASQRESLRQALGLPPTAFVVGSVGRLADDPKRFSDLIRALSQLAPALPQLFLLIVGDGKDRGMLEQLSESLGVADRVRFVGYQSDVGPMFSLMHVFALASARESFGLVLVEAMFSGLPVVATNVGGIADIVVPGETGLLVPTHEPRALAEAIQRLSTDGESRQRLGRAGLLRAEQMFGAARYVNDVDALYQELVSA